MLLNAEPELDAANPAQAVAALKGAEMVVVMSAFKHGAEYADVLLPVAPFAETSGTFVNCEGRVQSFNGTVKPLGEARPAWKVLRVLGSLLGRPDFDFDSIEQVRAACLGGRDLHGLLSNRIGATDTSVSVSSRSTHASSGFARRSSSSVRRCALPVATSIWPRAAR